MNRFATATAIAASLVVVACSSDSLPDPVSGPGTVALSIIPGSPPPPACPPDSIMSNFNGTRIAAGNTIWFNTIFKPSGVPSTGGVVNFAESTIDITSGGVVTTVTVPNATITFSPSATTASTSYNSGTDTWITTVPASFTGNILLSGVGYTPPGGLPGGANPVTWAGSFTSNMPGFTMNWQWAAAAYTSFGPLDAIGPKSIDGNAMNSYANSDHAGTPEDFKSFVTGGARGGGGSNWTGSYSSTISPRVCSQ